LEQAAKLKTALNSSFSVLYVGEDSSVKADFKVTPPVSKAAIKRITNQIFKNNPNQGEENERIAS
jgi:hypothetical protein